MTDRWLHRVADWCVPASAMDWGKLTTHWAFRGYTIRSVYPVAIGVPPPTLHEVQQAISPDITPYQTRDSFRGFRSEGYLPGRWVEDA